MIQKLLAIAKKILNLNQNGYLHMQVPVLELDKVIPGHNTLPVTLIDYKFVYGNMLLEELMILAKIVRFFKPKKILEIGTYIGNTTLQLAANSNARIFTLDLPSRTSDSAVSYKIVDPDLDVYPQEPGIVFKKSAYSSRIKQLYGDSYHFNFSAYRGKVDFVFVDGNHHYEYVKRDSLNALKMLAPKGIIAWHDYAAYAPGVVKVLNQLNNKFPLIHIKNTSLVVYKKNQ